MRSEKNRIALSGASRNAQRALDAVSSADLKHIHDDDKTAWAMAALIHCDVCRLVVSFDECQVEGVARLLHLADVASKLFEARNWYNNAGKKLLLKIAERNSVAVDTVRKKIEQLKQTHQIHRVNRYENYRNKVGYHYDAKAITYLQGFGAEDSNHFSDVLTEFVKFSGSWAQLTKDLIQDAHLNSA